MPSIYLSARKRDGRFAIARQNCNHWHCNHHFPVQLSHCFSIYFLSRDPQNARKKIHQSFQAANYDIKQHSDATKDYF